jgi:predicted CXXCH cytochrome family protein
MSNRSRSVLPSRCSHAWPIAAALLLVAGCRHSSAGAEPAAGGGIAPRARVEFEGVPALEASHVLNPHDHKGKPLCQRCHVSGEQQPFIDPIALCIQCHDPKHMKHPYNVVQATGAEGLPLLPGRLIACHTCHDPHDVKKNRAGLRAEYVSLCSRCHQRHGKKAAPPR